MKGLVESSGKDDSRAFLGLKQNSVGKSNGKSLEGDMVYSVYYAWSQAHLWMSSWMLLSELTRQVWFEDRHSESFHL